MPKRKSGEWEYSKRKVSRKRSYGTSYPNVSTARVTRSYSRVTRDENLFAGPEINFNFIYALDITHGTLYGWKPQLSSC